MLSSNYTGKFASGAIQYAFYHALGLRKFFLIRFFFIWDRRYVVTYRDLHSSLPACHRFVHGATCNKLGTFSSNYDKEVCSPPVLTMDYYVY